MPDGRVVEAITLTNDTGMTVRVIALGAAIQSVIVPDRDGRAADVAIGYPTLDGYLAKPEYFGATVGRVANRIDPPAAHGHPVSPPVFPGLQIAKLRQRGAHSLGNARAMARSHSAVCHRPLGDTDLPEVSRATLSARCGSAQHRTLTNPRWPNARWLCGPNSPKGFSPSMNPAENRNGTLRVRSN